MWNDLNHWLEYAVKHEPIIFLKNSSFKPLQYELQIRKVFEAHNIHENTEEIATFAKPDVKELTPYKLLNPIIIQQYNDIYKNNESMALRRAYLEKFCSFIYFISVVAEFNKEEQIEIDKFVDKDEEGSIKSNCKVNCYGDSVLIEKIVYVGKTMDLNKRFAGGHKATQCLNDPKWNICKEKRIYVATVELNESTGLATQALPLEALQPAELIDDILSFLESLMIVYFKTQEYYNSSSTKLKKPANFTNWPNIICEKINVNFGLDNLKSPVFEDGFELETDKGGNYVIKKL